MISQSCPSDLDALVIDWAHRRSPLCASLAAEWLRMIGRSDIPRAFIAAARPFGGLRAIQFAPTVVERIASEVALACGIDEGSAVERGDILFVYDRTDGRFTVGIAMSAEFAAMPHERGVSILRCEHPDRVFNLKVG